MNAILGSYTAGSTHNVDRWRDGAKIATDVTVKLWTFNNGGSTGDSHGRYDPISAATAGQWTTGDKFCFEYTGAYSS